MVNINHVLVTDNRWNKPPERSRLLEVIREGSPQKSPRSDILPSAYNQTAKKPNDIIYRILF